MTEEAPSQQQLWDAYGHAMGAASGLEKTMRIALWDAARTYYANDPVRRDRAIEKIAGKTFGGTARIFKAVFPGFAANPKFVAALDTAVRFRNHFAHHFLDDRIEALRTEEGLDLAIFECNLVMGHFEDVEYFVRALCPADFKGFWELSEARAHQWITDHPLHDLWLAYRAGEIEPGEALKKWQREQMRSEDDLRAERAAVTDEQ